MNARKAKLIRKVARQLTSKDSVLETVPGTVRVKHFFDSEELRHKTYRTETFAYPLGSFKNNVRALNKSMRK